jgi:hypothetical protein
VVKKKKSLSFPYQESVPGCPACSLVNILSYTSGLKLDGWDLISSRGKDFFLYNHVHISPEAHTVMHLMVSQALNLEKGVRT